MKGNKMSEVIEFDPEIKNFEKQIIEFLTTTPIFLGQKSKTLTIKAYFITRKILSQKKLKELTGFSSGTISQELKGLINKGIIEKTKISSTGEITYVMKSVEKAILNSDIDKVREEINLMEEDLHVFKSELENDKEELKSVKGFNKIYQLIDLFVYSVSFYKFIEKLFEDEYHAFLHSS
jgi:predicted transcriptional regulator